MKIHRESLVKKTSLGRTKGPWWGGWKSVHSNHEVGLRAFKQEIVGEYAEVVSNQTNANTLTQPPTVFYNSRLLISCKAVGGKVKDTVAFWDPARTIYLITHKNANKLGLHGRKCVLEVKTDVYGPEKWNTKSYFVLLADHKEKEHEVIAYGVHNITDSLEAIVVAMLPKYFPGLDSAKVGHPSGGVDLMFGITYARFHSTLSMKYAGVDNESGSYLHILESRLSYWCMNTITW